MSICILWHCELCYFCYCSWHYWVSFLPDFLLLSVGLQHYTPNVSFCEFYIHSLGIPTELPCLSKLMSYGSLCLFCLIILQCSVLWTQSPVHMRKVFYHWAYTPKFLQIFYSLWLTIFLWFFFLLLNMSPKCFYVFCSGVQGRFSADAGLFWIIHLHGLSKWIRH